MADYESITRRTVLKAASFLALPSGAAIADEPGSEIKRHAAFDPISARVAESINKPLQTYRVLLNSANTVGSGEGDPSTNPWYKGHTFHPLLFLYAGNRGSFPVPGATAKSCLERVVDQLICWSDDEGEAAPPCRGGYHCQHEQAFVTSVALARIIPSVWDHPRLLAKYKTRLSLMMEACLVAYCVTTSDYTPFPRGFGEGKERTIRGFTAGRSSNPNFSSPALLAPPLIAAFMELNGKDPVAWMDNWRRSDFSAELEAAGGMNECRATFAQDWTTAFQKKRYGPAVKPVGRGHTAAEIKAALNNAGNPPFKAFGKGLADYRDVFVHELRDRTFAHPVSPGLPAKRWPQDYGPLVGETGPGWETPQGINYGKNTANQLRGCLGRPEKAGNASQTVKSAWLNLPNAGAYGMHFEFDTTNGPNPNYRSSASYAMGGMQATMQIFICMILYGKFSPDDPIWSDIRPRFQVGVRDFNYRARYGHRSYANGGVGNSGSEDFGMEWLSDNDANWPAFMDMMNMMARWWGLPDFPTDD